MLSLRLVQAVEVFVCTLVSWCLQCACSFGITFELKMKTSYI